MKRSVNIKKDNQVGVGVKVSVIILNWNRKEDVSLTLTKLSNQTAKPFEIIVVDNASTDGSIKHITKHFPKVKIVKLLKNIGLAGFNLGMESALGDYFLLLASDSIPNDDLIAKHLTKFKNNPSLGVSCPSTFELQTKKYLAPNRAKEGNNKLGYTVTYFDGNGICLRREVFKKTGGYANDYFICLEELEWAVRILSMGFEIKCFTDAVVYNSKALVGGEARKRYGYYYARNWIWFYIQYLPLTEIPSFLSLHAQSFFVKTNKKAGTMTKLDILKGIFSGFVGSVKYIRQRKVLSPDIIDRLKLDLFPNSKHLYT